MFFQIIIAIVFAFLSGLGVGGGSLLMLWLTYIVGMEYSAAKATNLLFFVFPCAISCISNYRSRRISVCQLLPASITGILFAVIFSKVSAAWDTKILRFFFGILLLFTSLRELRTKSGQSIQNK